MPKVSQVTSKSKSLITYQMVLEKKMAKVIKRYAKAKEDISSKNLHDLRVAIRRLLTLLKIIKIFEKADVKKFIKLLKNIMDPLGDYRDSLLHLTFLENSEIKTEPALEEYHQQLLKKINKQEKIVRRVLKDFDIASFQNKLYSQIPLKLSRKTLKNSARWDKYIRKIIQKILESKEKVFQKMDLDEFHKTRIRFKKIRYLLEICTDWSFEIPKENLEIISRIQTTMGDIHDIDLLAEDMLKFNQSLYPQKEGLSIIPNFVEGLQEKRWILFESFRKEFEKFENQFAVV